MKRGTVYCVGVMLALVCVALWLEPAWADKLADAIAKTPKGTEVGQINDQAPTGYLGIPGAPSVNMLVAFFWAIWVGWIFSSVGAFGGVMAGVGHITIFGIGNYGATFRKTAPELNKLITDTIRTANQWLGGTSAAISSLNYWRMGRLVLPLGLSLGAGSVVGSFLVPWLTAGKISFKAYVGYFGLFVLFLGCFLLYQTLPMVRDKNKKAKEAAKAFEASVKQQREGGQVDFKEQGVKLKKFTLSKVTFTFFGVEFSFNPFVPAIGGFFIACVASFLGVGGGFLLVPFLTAAAGLPMYLAAGTSAFAVLVGMITSISTFMGSGVPVHWPLVGMELVGVVVGSMIGPRTSKYIPDIWLKRIFIVLAFYVGIRYSLRGFFGIQI